MVPPYKAWLEKVKGNRIKAIWGQGKIFDNKAYLECSQAIYFEWENGNVSKIFPKRENRQSIGYELAIEEQLNWQRNKPYLSLKEISSVKGFEPFLANPISYCKLNMGSTYENRYIVSSKAYKSVFVQSLCMVTDKENTLYIGTCKVTKRAEVVNYYNGITVFFTKATYLQYQENVQQTWVW